MDKPALLEAIQRNHPLTPLHIIKQLAEKELNRQVDEAILGMMNKKPIHELLAVIQYKEPEAVSPMLRLPASQKKRK